MKSHEFASLLCSRLCHDLLSPVGALNNGIELLADEHDPEMRARCLDLLGESARASANKLKFFRLAFGAAGGFGDVVDTREARAAIEGLFGGDGRIKLGWMVDEPTMSKSALKVLLNVVLIAGDALVRGGTLDIGAERHGSGLEIVVRAEGSRIVLDPELRKVLVGETPEDEVAPRAAAAWLVHCLVEEGGGRIQVAEGQEGMLLIGARFRLASPSAQSFPEPAGASKPASAIELRWIRCRDVRIRPNPAWSGSAPSPARRPRRRRRPTRAGSAPCRRTPGP